MPLFTLDLYCTVLHYSIVLYCTVLYNGQVDVLGEMPRNGGEKLKKVCEVSITKSGTTAVEEP